MYAFELASTPKTGKADRELSLFYARKCLTEKDGSDFWGNFVALAWQYLMPEANSKLVENDPVAGRSVVLLLMEHLETYLQSNLAADKKKFRLQGLIQCMEQLQKQYQDPRSPLCASLTSKERTQHAQSFREQAELLRKKLAAL